MLGWCLYDCPTDLAGNECEAACVCWTQFIQQQLQGFAKPGILFLRCARLIYKGNGSLFFFCCGRGSAIEYCVRRYRWPTHLTSEGLPCVFANLHVDLSAAQR